MAVVAPKQRVQAPATRPLPGGLFSQFRLSDTLY